MLFNLRVLSKHLSPCIKPVMLPNRTVHIFTRKNSIRLSKLGESPKKLKKKHYYYDVKFQWEAKPINMVLLQDVPGIGMAGEHVTLKTQDAYQKLLLPKLAVYATSAEALNIKKKEESLTSSIYTKMVGNYIESQALPIFLSSDNEWTLEPWHVKASLRRIGIFAKDECIKLPETKISGPNPEVENKDFVVQITLNKMETFPMRCRIYLFDKSDTNKVTNINSKSTTLFAEDKGLVDSLMKKQLEINKSISLLPKTPEPEEKTQGKKRKKRSRVPKYKLVYWDEYSKVLDNGSSII